MKGISSDSVLELSVHIHFPFPVEEQFTNTKGHPGLKSSNMRIVRI